MLTSSGSGLSDQISQTIDQLRQLTQLSVQTNWRYCQQDLPIESALQPDSWQHWGHVRLNDRNHIAWAKGRQVIWLGQTLLVSPDLQGYPLQGLCLRIALTWWAELAQIFVNGQLVQEGDLFDHSTRLRLSPTVTLGEEITIALRLVSPGHDDGALVRSICLYEVEDASPDSLPEPSFIADELTVLQTYLQAFEPERSAVLAEAVAQLDWSVVADRTAFDQSLTNLRDRLLPLSKLIKQRQIQLVGHAHLDMAWLWTVSETWEAAERTFKSVLHLQTDFPELTFCHSTPALYDWMEQNRPQLFKQIQAQVAAGWWEPVGGLWIEPELNIISGESIVRQVLYGQRYVQQKFGRLDRIAWLPDSFGFSWQLPQILQQGGIDYFVTQKLLWNDTTKFPHEVFEWQAPDGSKIFSLMSAPIGEGIDPVKMATYACNWEQKTGIPIALWLPGVGDHGGGPTRDMLELARRWQRSPFFPELRFTTAQKYLEQIEHQIHKPQPYQDTKSGKPALNPTPNPHPPSPIFPTWNSELYLEFHRGCYTTHADQKRFNRRCEELLYQAELWASLATIGVGVEYPKAELETAWKQVLFNQFHDILPGSSITEVFEDANQAWEAAEAVGQRVLHQSLQTLAQQIALPLPPFPDAQPLVVFNPLNWQRSEVIKFEYWHKQLPDQPDQFRWRVYDVEGQEIKLQSHRRLDQGMSIVSFLAENIPAIGYRCFWLYSDESDALTIPLAKDSSTRDHVLENEFLSVTLDPATGDLASVFDKLQQREVLSGPGNQLQAFKDDGQYWDAWNIDPEYAKHPLPVEFLHIGDAYFDAHEAEETSICVARKIGQATFNQVYSLQAGSPILKITTSVDWLHDRHILVKAAFPLNLEADSVSCEIPCGTIQRTTKPQTDAEKAQWEIPALHWVDLSDADYGVSLLNESKHGYDCQPDQIRLTLLRGSQFPDPEADKGYHAFTYALYPHSGNWQVARTVQHGYELNQPLKAVLISAQLSTRKTLPPVGQFLDLGAGNLVLMAFKQSEDSPYEWVLRCYECQGEEAKLTFSSNLNLRLEASIDLLERTLDSTVELPDAQTKIQGQTAIVHPWKIASFKLVMTKRSVVT